ncbi:hypothetical protein [Enterococcus gilvus]|uniref:Uncharacterized protein n=1 Tax=Enterococcus gilvus ATCC BAA-350 TaxID=1158614 RepID=R2XNE9_9ENTE|nr:hypothetical protein [Enterococcus gilvus]EOI51507.1 hypothetical protein UKC_04182 [Enterococcus gilvus ATCC BAA-350]EOW77182.1 hypothetical protein I592_04158 [Enterococcus gilvus ATCC BAA-350]OJG41155.1 hypothetical protein RV02_GL001242 [Enterococcus gilvus]
MENSIKREFSILLARKCAQGFLYLALLISLLHMAIKGWNLVGDNVKLVFLEGTETTVLLSTLFHFVAGMIIIAQLFFFGTKFISGEFTKNYLLIKVKLYFVMYVLLGGVFYLGFIETEYVSMNQLEQLLGNLLCYFLLRRLSAVADRKLKLEIFPLSETALSLKGDTWKLPDEWKSYLIYQFGEKETVKTYKLGSGGTWLEESYGGKFVACYRIRYTPFHFKVENNQIFPKKVAYGKS